MSVVNKFLCVKNNIMGKLCTIIIRVVSRFLIKRFHPKSRRLFPFYFSNITLRTDPLTLGVTGTVFKIAGETRGLPAYFDNPGNYYHVSKVQQQFDDQVKINL